MKIYICNMSIFKHFKTINNVEYYSPSLPTMIYPFLLYYLLQAICTYHISTILLYSGWLDRTEVEPFSLGQVWYLVAIQWWNLWCKYVDFKVTLI